MADSNISNEHGVDEHCDPNNPRIVKYEDILAAARRIVGIVMRTPLLKSHMGEKYGMDLYYKAEFLQRVGSFNERGACNVLACLTDEQKKFGVITASTGNHALAMCYHAMRNNIPCCVVMPASASPLKMEKCRELSGNKVVIHGEDIAEAKQHALDLALEKKMVYINGYDHVNIIEGQGTIGIEIVEQLPDVDAILVPVGGGGLIAGIATAVKHLKPDTEIYGIQTDKTFAMTETLRKNERVHIAINNTIAEGLAINKVGVNSFASIKGTVDKMIIVKEDWVMRGILHVIEEEKFVVEGAGATTIATIMAGLLPNLKGKKVVCVFSGGNMDPKVLSRCIERAMAIEGRLVKFRVSLEDKEGAFTEFCSLISNIGVTIRDFVPQRTWVTSEIFYTEVKVIAETSGLNQAKELTDLVKKHYKEAYFHQLSEHARVTTERRGPCLAPNPVCMMK
ncbi:hypothetical protein JYU34_018652 [Plutella xylostella]|uniref:L-serine deaminase n=1 Tax=Plutella xylostella TaxID=51655 RepID=A0ABQ7PY33_PLUXY|nr:hypothetical protein JYU34_018652 [Plutella xylostella]